MPGAQPYPGIVLLPADYINLQIFKLIVGGSLFKYKSYLEYMLDKPMGHLWQMLCLTREQVNSSKLGAQYFDLTVKPNDIDNPFCFYDTITIKNQDPGFCM
jgi:hypothetical protein